MLGVKYKDLKKTTKMDSLQTTFGAIEYGRESWSTSGENPTGAPGQGALTNYGAKGAATQPIAPGQTITILDVTGAGIVTRIWLTMLTNFIVNSDTATMLKYIHIRAYWDNAQTPAISMPIGDFHAFCLGQLTTLDNVFFSSSESRNFECIIPMYFKERALIQIINFHPTITQKEFYYQVDYDTVPYLNSAFPYFHAYWNRNYGVPLGQAHEILPKVNGWGYYVGSHLAVMLDNKYKGHGMWFGEGLVKYYKNADTTHPTLVTTGLEDYNSDAYGLGEYKNHRSGCLKSDNTNGLYNMYRYLTSDKKTFSTSLRVTVQLLGNATLANLKAMVAGGAQAMLVNYRGATTTRHLLDENNGVAPDIATFQGDNITDDGTNFFYVSPYISVALFYLGNKENGLPLHSLADMTNGF